jgi:hypothetical protein
MIWLVAGIVGFIIGAAAVVVGLAIHAKNQRK